MLISMAASECETHINQNKKIMVKKKVKKQKVVNGLVPNAANIDSSGSSQREEFTHGKMSTTELLNGIMLPVCELYSNQNENIIKSKKKKEKKVKKQIVNEPASNVANMHILENPQREDYKHEKISTTEQLKGITPSPNKMDIHKNGIIKPSSPKVTQKVAQWVTQLTTPKKLTTNQQVKNINQITEEFGIMLPALELHNNQNKNIVKSKKKKKKKVKKQIVKEPASNVANMHILENLQSEYYTHEKISTTEQLKGITPSPNKMDIHKKGQVKPTSPKVTQKVAQLVTQITTAKKLTTNQQVKNINQITEEFANINLNEKIKVKKKNRGKKKVKNQKAKELAQNADNIVLLDPQKEDSIHGKISTTAQLTGISLKKTNMNGNKQINPTLPKVTQKKDTPNVAQEFPQMTAPKTLTTSQMVKEVIGIILPTWELYNNQNENIIKTKKNNNKNVKKQIVNELTTNVANMDILENISTTDQLKGITSSQNKTNISKNGQTKPILPKVTQKNDTQKGVSLNAAPKKLTASQQTNKTPQQAKKAQKRVQNAASKILTIPQQANKAQNGVPQNAVSKILTTPQQANKAQKGVFQNAASKILTIPQQANKAQKGVPQNAASKILTTPQQANKAQKGVSQNAAPQILTTPQQANKAQKGVPQNVALKKLTASQQANKAQKGVPQNAASKILTAYQQANKAQKGVSQNAAPQILTTPQQANNAQKGVSQNAPPKNKTASQLAKKARKAKRKFYKKFDLMQIYNNVNQSNEIPRDSLTYLINQQCAKAVDLKMEVIRKEVPFKVPARWKMIDQIENHNPFIFAAFALMKKEYSITNQDHFESVELYHNTTLENASNILLNNLDYRKNLKGRRRYGPGVCFSNDLYYCYDCTKETSEEFILISVEVLVGKRVDRDKYVKKNKISIDTGVSLNDKVYVKARDDEFYPKYICRYRPN